MKKTEYRRMAEREATYWWHLGRLRIISTYIDKSIKDRKTKPKILNVGCGTGGTIPTLEYFGKVDNTDISEDAVSFMKQSGYKNVIKTKGIKLPFKEQTYDIVGAFDVLEHIEDQVGALKEWSRVLKNDGIIVLTVPAYQWLWSDHDVSLHHMRRYTRSTLIKAAKQARLRPYKISYAIVFSLPLVVGFRYVNKIRGRKTDSETSYVNVPNFINTIFTKILYVEAFAHKYISFFTGTTVVAVFRKDTPQK